MRLLRQDVPVAVFNSGGATVWFMPAVCYAEHVLSICSMDILLLTALVV